MKNIMIVVIVLVIITAGLMYFFQSNKTLKQNSDNLPNDVSLAAEKKNETPQKSDDLYNLKNSIGSIIDDSVEEDIQKAVEDEVLKTTETKK